MSDANIIFNGNREVHWLKENRIYGHTIFSQSRKSGHSIVSSLCNSINNTVMNSLYIILYIFMLIESSIYEIFLDVTAESKYMYN